MSAGLSGLKRVFLWLCVWESVGWVMFGNVVVHSLFLCQVKETGPSLLFLFSGWSGEITRSL